MFVLACAVSCVGLGKARAQETESEAYTEDQPAKAPETLPAKPGAKLDAALRAHVPGSGVTVAGADWAELRISLFGYVRYLNQLALDETYTDAFGNTLTLDRRQDVQLQKAIIYFKGFLGTERFRYLFYVWTSNTSLGLGAQVVVAGNLTYRFADWLQAGAGIGGLPATRSVRGQWPRWLRQDARPLADEYFRASYTTGVWASGDLPKGLHYHAMIGNNLSQLGIDAGQLDDGFDTVSTALWWTFRDFGTYGPFGDFERHERLAASLGASYTRSAETPQSQPGTESPENTQIRLSDGTAIFDDGALAAGIQLERALYRMLALDAAMKIRGFSLEGEYFFRWVGGLRASGPLPFDRFFDHGFQLQASMMIWKRMLQGYVYGSVVFGEYGTPYDLGAGLNWYPFETRLLRFNGEAMYTRGSPVGYLSYPLLVGATGPTFMANLELLF